MEEEYQVLSWLLEAKQIQDDAKIVVVRERFDPRGQANIPDEYLRENFKEIEETTLKDFADKSNQDVSVERQLHLKLPYVILGDEEMNALFSIQDGWDNFYKKFESATGIIQISRVGFNVEHSQALVCIGEQSYWLAGYGAYFLLEKQNGLWKIADSTNAWIS